MTPYSNEENSEKSSKFSLPLSKLFKAVKADKVLEKKHKRNEMIKIEKPIPKCSTEIKLEKNRVSAKKCRQRKKFYIQMLEEELKNKNAEIQKFKEIENDANKLSFETKMKELEVRESEYITEYDINYNDYTNVNNKILINKKIKKDSYGKLQTEIVIDLYKKLIKSIIPVEIKVFIKQFINLKDIKNFDDIDTLLNNIIENQRILEEVYNFDLFGIEQKISLPLQTYCFFEHMKNFTIHFNEFHSEARRL